MGLSNDEHSIKEHFKLELPGFDTGCSYYLLLCNGGGVTVRSQQMRAMNLAWALRGELRKNKVAVIGGGAAGITFASAAAKLGAEVRLFESSKLMHLQTGSWHRPLHPEIYTWPKSTAYRPVFHLPLVGWTTGTAHDVATEIVSKFRTLGKHLGEERLKVHEGERATLTNEGKLKVNGSEYPSKIQIVVLAVGFGIEDSPIDLPFNSYWRVDALDQSFLGEGKPTVVVSGAGDGALIEVLRSCVQEFDQGPFLDRILALTLRDQELREMIKKVEDNKRSEQVWSGYLGLSPHCRSLLEIDKLLSEKKRDIAVKWLFRSKSPFNGPSLPINRFLVSRLVFLTGTEAKFDLELYPAVENVTVSSIKGGRYLVEYDRDRSKHESILCQQALCRWGSKKYESEVEEKFRQYPKLLWSVASVFEAPTSKILKRLNTRFRKSKDKTHNECNLPCGWEKDGGFMDALDSKRPKKPTLLAEFVEAFDAPDLKFGDIARMVYRIRIWLRDVDDHLTVRYDLHPEEENKPISRLAMGPNYEQWLNTRNDYQIRVHTSDGFEWPLGTVLKALRRRYKLPREQDHESGAGAMEILKRQTEERRKKLQEEQTKEISAANNATQ